MPKPILEKKLPIRIKIFTERGPVLVNRDEYLDSGKDPNQTRFKRHDHIQPPTPPLIPRQHYSNGHMDPEPE